MHPPTPRQTDLLTHALTQDGQLFPLPPQLGPLSLAKRAIVPLLRRKLLVEVAVYTPASAWRTSDDQHYGLMLTRTGGAALSEMTAATGWQPHSIRAALTGLRKQGLTILLSEIDGERRYRLLEAA